MSKVELSFNSCTISGINLVKENHPELPEIFSLSDNPFQPPSTENIMNMFNKKDIERARLVINLQPQDAPPRTIELFIYPDTEQELRISADVMIHDMFSTKTTTTFRMPKEICSRFLQDVVTIMEK